MKTYNLERYLESFGRQVTNRAKGSLQKAKGGGTQLEKSIRYEVDIVPQQGFEVRFYMNAYGKFVDKGVSGTKKIQKYKNYLGKVVSSPFSYSNSIGHRQPPTGIIDKWMVKKGIAPRDSSGKFKKRKSIAYLIARSIGINGIKSTAFFQKPLMLGIKQFGDKMLKSVSQDVKESLDTTITKVR